MKTKVESIDEVVVDDGLLSDEALELVAGGLARIWTGRVEPPAEAAALALGIPVTG